MVTLTQNFMRKVRLIQETLSEPHVTMQIILHSIACPPLGSLKRDIGKVQHDDIIR
jgi:hypothetical protein